MDAVDDYATYVLIAKMKSVRTLSQLLKAVNFKDHAMFCATSNGFKVTVEDAKSVQACAFIQTDIFEQYYLKEDIVVFKINLTVLLECLNVFGTAVMRGAPTHLKICYAGYGSPVILKMMDEGVLTVCEVVTREPEDVLDFSFVGATIVNKIIFQSECMKDVFTNLDSSSDVVGMLLSPDPPHFRMSTTGNSSNFHMDIPKDSDVITSFQCTQTQTIRQEKTFRRYKTSLIKFCSKALNLSQEASIRTDERGFLCFQFKIHTEDGHCCFVDHFVSPEEDGEPDPDH